MKDKHTPGSWHHDEYGHICAGPQIIGKAYQFELDDSDHDELPYQANARLMAASPKMYEFIEKLATTLIPTGVAHSFASTSILHAIVDSAKNLTKEIEGDE